MLLLTGFINVTVFEKNNQTNKFDFKGVEFFHLLMSTTVMCPVEKASYID